VQFVKETRPASKTILERGGKGLGKEEGGEGGRERWAGSKFREKKKNDHGEEEHKPEKRGKTANGCDLSLSTVIAPG